MSSLSYARHRFPPAIIQHAVWLYFRFALSYRDVEDRSGYIGELELLPVDTGLRVRVVGPGTPASLAESSTGDTGLQVDDIITHFNGEPVFKVDRFDQLLGKTKPKDQIELTVQRVKDPE